MQRAPSKTARTFEFETTYYNKEQVRERFTIVAYASTGYILNYKALAAVVGCHPGR